MAFQLVQAETNHTVEHHSWNNKTTNGTQRVRFGNILFRRVHGFRVQIVLCICENEYLKLVKVTLFTKLIDHNLIYDHTLFVCQI